jgi:excisionase family DNA binding protein
MEKQLFSRQEVAEVLGISKGMVDKLLGLGKLQPTRIGRRVLFHRDYIEKIARNPIVMRMRKPAKDTKEKKLAC